MTTTTTTEITTLEVLPAAELDAYLGDYGERFDRQAIRDEYLAALNDAVGEGIRIAASGQVYADLDAADRARDLDWDALMREVDLAAIVERHDLDTDYGTLHDLQTGEALRPATRDEAERSNAALERGSTWDPSGSFEGDDGRTVYVQP